VFVLLDSLFESQGKHGQNRQKVPRNSDFVRAERHLKVGISCNPPENRDFAAETIAPLTGRTSLKSVESAPAAKFALHVLHDRANHCR
jgi:hypothetical protein